MARALFTVGLRTVQAISNASIDVLCDALAAEKPAAASESVLDSDIHAHSSRA